MVQKSKPKKHLAKLSSAGQVKKNGKQSNISQFNSHFDALGLKVIKVTADGNCFFRALADQLEGNEEEHEKYRLMVVEYIMKHREEFEPFIEDEAPFDEYCESMKTDGTWAGNMELQAASLVTRSNICIHRIMSPRWYIRNFDNNGTHMIHLSYHEGEHYDSVRLKDDPCRGPAKPFTIEVDGNLSGTSHQAKAVAMTSKSVFCKNIIDATSIKLVMAGTGCEDVQKAEQVLLEVDGSIDAAIEFLISEQQMGENEVQNCQLPCGDENSDGRGHAENEGSKQTKEEEAKDKNCGYSEHVNDSPPVLHGDSSLHDDKIPMPNNIPRNKVCPCGSRKKYKACCGAVGGRSAKIVINQNVTNKARKGKARGGKADFPAISPSLGSKGGPLDLGALCI